MFQALLFLLLYRIRFFQAASKTAPTKNRRHSTVVYFDQLLGAARTRQLVETFLFSTTNPKNAP